MRKDEARREIGKILEKVSNIICDLEDLSYELDDTLNEIEPYEGKDELTEQQEERKEWFDEVIQVVDDFRDRLEDEELYNYE